MKRVKIIFSVIIFSFLLLIGIYSLSCKVYSLEEKNKFKNFYSSLTESSENRNVRVAILDSGIDSKHSYFQNIEIKEYNVMNPNQYATDILGHGTAIAGIITNVGNIHNAESNVEIYSVKVLDDNGKGSYVNVIEGLEWCIQNNIDIINLSFGFKKNNTLLQDKIQEMTANNIIVIASAGNKYGFEADYPAAYNEVISVSAINEDNEIAEFSAKGKIDFYTNGTDIPILLPNDQYGMKYGSSLATAHITGLVTLIFQKYSDLDTEKNQYSQVMNLLQNVSNKNSKNQNIIKFGKLDY